MNCDMCHEPIVAETIDTGDLGYKLCEYCAAEVTSYIEATAEDRKNKD